MLEELIKDLTAALRENTAAVKAAGGSAAASTKGKASDAAIAAAAQAKVEKDKPTLDTIKSRFGDYLGITDKEKRKERGVQVKRIVDHFGVEKASLLGEADWKQALEWLSVFEAGKEPDIPAAESEGSSLV